MLRYLFARFAGGGFRRRTFLSSYLTYNTRQLVDKGVGHHVINKDYANYTHSSTVSPMGVSERPLQGHKDQHPVLGSSSQRYTGIWMPLASWYTRALLYLLHRTSTQCDAPIGTLSWEPLLMFGRWHS